MKDGDVSIVLKNVTVSDAGRYKCRIIMSNAASGERVLSEERSLSVTDAGELEFVFDETCSKAAGFDSRKHVSL